MQDILLLENTNIMAYDWGSATAFTELLGIPNPDGGPRAELWMGAHPNAPSGVVRPDGTEALDALIARCPVEFLGPAVSKRFDGRLPFLFKVLAAGRPLSLQAHPDRDSARKGFADENRRGIALDDHRRNYRDSNHKPECLCALTPFWAMSGFRRPAEILELLGRLCPRSLAAELERFRGECDAAGLKRLFAALLRLPDALRPAVVAEAAAHAHRLDEAAGRWVCELARRYPGDVGAIAPALLHVLRLDPGQALFMPAGILHTYLDGTGIEIMANSDNVVRGGLTSKHVDEDELLKILRFDTYGYQIVETKNLNRHEKLYVTPAEEFALTVIRLGAGRSVDRPEGHGIEILLCTEGRAAIARRSGAQPPVGLERGAAAIVPAAAGGYRLSGEATLYKATVPEKGAGR